MENLAQTTRMTRLILSGAALLFYTSVAVSLPLNGPSYYDKQQKIKKNSGGFLVQLEPILRVIRSAPYPFRIRDEVII